MMMTEGGQEGCKGISNWDAFTKTHSDAIRDHSSGSVAIDHYHMFREDVKVMKKLGLKSYRFSISWTRILPEGRISGGICEDGIKFYNSLIDELVAAEIEPCATIFHWDTPQCLEDEYGGFLDERIVQDFREFAEICFWEFGDRVKLWITLNEPWSYCCGGYATGKYPPNHGAVEKLKHLSVILRISHTFTFLVEILNIEKKQDGDPGTEPYKVAHNMILCHARAVDIYRKKYKKSQGGKIGMSNCCIFYEPLTDSQEERDAARRAFDFNMGWSIEPQITGDYPASMIELVGDRLPRFNEADKKLVQGSYDFLGINNYTSRYASNDKNKYSPHYNTDSKTHITAEREGVSIGPQAGSDWLNVVPWGIYKLMMFIKNTYNDPVIYITENGVDEQNTSKRSIEKVLADRYRIHYHQHYLCYVRRAISEGAKVKAYYIWSLFDNFEWVKGFTVRFRICFADRSIKGRLAKDSAIWWQNFLTEKPVRLPSKKGAESSEENRKRTRNN